MLSEGTYRARAAELDFGFAGTGTEQIAVRFLTTEGESITWYGYFTDKAAQYAIQALRACGWKGDDLFELTVEDLPDEVELVVQEDEYDGQTRMRVAFINALGSGSVALKERMDDAQRRKFAARMKGLCMKVKPSASPSPAPTPAEPADAFGDDDDIPF